LIVLDPHQQIYSWFIYGEVTSEAEFSILTRSVRAENSRVLPATSNITGRIPAATMVRAGRAAASQKDSDVNCHTRTARVS